MKDVSKLENFGYRYFDLCNGIANLINNSDCQLDEPKAKNFIQKFFNRFRKKKLDISGNNVYRDFDILQETYRSIIHEYDSIDSIWNFPYFLVKFIYFIKIAEKCFFYINDDNYSKIYAEYDETNKKYKLTIFCEDINIIYDIQESEINMPGNIKNDSPLSFLYKDEKYMYDNVTSNAFFVNLTVKRLYGETMKNEYKYVCGSPIPLYISDDFLIHRIFNISKQIVFETMIDIFNNTICKMSKLEGKINIKEVFENGTVDVWRSRSK